MKSWIEAIVCFDILSQDFLSESGNFLCVVTNLDTSQWKHEVATVNGLINHYRIFLFAIDTVAAVFVNTSQPVHRMLTDAHEGQPLQNRSLMPDGCQKLLLRHNQALSIWNVSCLLLQLLFQYSDTSVNE